MSSETQEPPERSCPMCGYRPLQGKFVRDEFDYGPEENRVRVVAEDVPVMACSQCGETLHGPDAARVWHLAICRTLELLTPEQIKAVREGLGKSPAAFARLTGIAEKTLSRWEAGRLLPTRALDRFLRLLQSVPGAVAVLEQLDAPTNGKAATGAFPPATAERSERTAG